MPPSVYRNEKGIVLPLVLVVFSALLLLVFTAISVTSAENKESAWQSRRMQAFYLARSGAETFATYLIEKAYTTDFAEMMQFLDNIANKTSDAAEIEDGTLVIETVRRTEKGEEKLDIIARGTYQGVTEMVTVTLQLTIKETEDYDPSTAQHALMVFDADATKAFQLTGGAFVDGDVILNTTKENSVVFRGGQGFNIKNGALYLPHGADPHHVIDTDRGESNGNAPEEYKKPELPDWQWINNWAFWKNIEEGVKFMTMPAYPSAVFPEPVFPDFPHLPPAKNPIFTTPQDKVYYLTEDGYYEKIHPTSGRTIKVDLAGGDRIIRVKHFQMDGNIELMNVGKNSKLILYVEDYFSTGTWSFNGNGNPENVQVYYAGAKPIILNGSTRFSGNIFVKQANLTLTAGGKMRGNVVTLGNHVEVSGGSSAESMALYAPLAHVEMGGSGQILGAVICRSFSRAGGGNAGIIYKPVGYQIPGEFFASRKSITINYDENPWR